jgi:predicted nucleic acid-binding protein
MSKKIFIDSDIILDLLAERELFYDNAARMFTLAYNKKIKLYTTAVIMANVFYVLRKLRGKEETKKRLKDLRLLVNILPINENIVDIALNSKFTDFEDALQYFTAKENNILAIITRNTDDYKTKEADIIVQTAEEYIKMN